jgi:hypothetical protein
VPATGFCRTRGPSAKRAVAASLLACICSRGGSPGQTAKCFVLALQLEGAAGRAATGFVVPGTFRQAGGLGTASPRLHMLAGIGSDGKCFAPRFSWNERAGRARSGFCRSRGTSAKAGGLVRPRPPACICSRGGGPGQTASVCSGVSAGRSGQAVPATVFVPYPGTFRQSGARTASPPACRRSGGGGPGQTGSVRLAFQPGKSGQAVPATVSVVPGDLSAKRGLVRLRARLMLAGGRSGSDGKRSSRVSSWKERAGPCPSNGFCRTGGPSAERGGSYGLAPRCSQVRRGGAVRVRRQVFVLAFQLEGAGRPCRQRFLSYPGDLPPSGGARTASLPRSACSLGAARVRRQAFVCPLFSWKERAGRAGNGFCRTRGPFAKRGLRRPRPPLADAGGQSGTRRECLSGVSAEGAGRPCRQRLFVVPGGPSAKRGGLVRPRLPACICSRGGSPGQTAVSVRLASAGKSGRPCQQRFVFPGDLSPSGGACSAPPPRRRRGAVRVRRQVFVSRFSWRAGRAGNGFCLDPGDLLLSGGNMYERG